MKTTTLCTLLSGITLALLCGCSNQPTLPGDALMIAPTTPPATPSPLGRDPAYIDFDHYTVRDNYAELNLRDK